jgi:thymidine kinase
MCSINNFAHNQLRTRSEIIVKSITRVRQLKVPSRRGYTNYEQIFKQKLTLSILETKQIEAIEKLNEKKRVRTFAIDDFQFKITIHKYVTHFRSTFNGSKTEK